MDKTQEYNQTLANVIYSAFPQPATLLESFADENKVVLTARISPAVFVEPAATVQNGQLVEFYQGVGYFPRFPPLIDELRTASESPYLQAMNEVAAMMRSKGGIPDNFNDLPAFSVENLADAGNALFLLPEDVQHEFFSRLHDILNRGKGIRISIEAGQTDYSRCSVSMIGKNGFLSLRSGIGQQGKKELIFLLDQILTSLFHDPRWDLDAGAVSNFLAEN